MMWVPEATAVGEYRTEQLADAPEPANMHAAAVPKLPGSLEAKLTAPVGTPPRALDTVTAQTDCAPTTTEVGWQATVVDDG